MQQSKIAPTPAAVLKAVRDGKAKNWNDLNRIFRDEPSLRISLRHTVGILENAGLIVWNDTSCSITETWRKIQGALGISLTLLHRMSEPGIEIVKPTFDVAESHRTVPDVFVLMPFQPKLKPIFTTHISRVVKNLGLTIGRADDFFTAHAVMKDVWTAIFRARIVIADCTGRNPNVFYEIGMAHTVGKPVILITQDRSDVPFDLRHIRFIKYTYTLPGMETFEQTLTSTIRDVVENGDYSAPALKSSPRKLSSKSRRSR